jgi:NAD(P)-dependent dehydrogenase (short-subunit alcohol dehydrogenase family)
MDLEPALSFTLPDAVAVSGASSGLGKSICRLLAERQVHTVGVDLNPAAAETKDLAAYLHVTGDVAEEGTWQEALAAARRHDPRKIGLVTAAAILHVGTILEESRSSIERILNVNVVGTALALKAFIPSMIELGGGPIVAIASIDATFAEQQLAMYAASKGAVRQLARTVALDHARNGVRVNVLSPGPMMAGLFERHLKSATDPAKFLATRSARQPTGSILTADEVAHVAMFLLSEGASAIVGADVIADGGLTTSFDFRTGSEGASVQ